MIPVDSIDHPDDQNGRLQIDHDRVRELATDIANTGQLHAITVRPHADRYSLIAGRHRLAAVRLLRHPTIAATIINVDDCGAAAIRLQENINRTNLSPVEEATQLAGLVHQHPEGVDGLAQMLGRSVSWVLDRLDMKDWPDFLLGAVHAKDVSLAAARQLAKVTDKELCRFYVQTAIDHGVTAATARYWVQQWKAGIDASTIISENKVESHSQVYETQTAVRCFTCNEPYSVETTIPVRVCEPCIRMIKEMQQQKQPNTTIPPTEKLPA